MYVSRENEKPLEKNYYSKIIIIHRPLRAYIVYTNNTNEQNEFNAISRYECVVDTFGRDEHNNGSFLSDRL